jgi:hypothetical protein
MLALPEVQGLAPKGLAPNRSRERRPSDHGAVAIMRVLPKAELVRSGRC